MHISAALAIGLQLASLAVAFPQPLGTNSTLASRVVEIKNLPISSPMCTLTITNGPEAKTYSDSDISAAIGVAVDAIIAGKQYFKKEGRTVGYPHQNTPGSGGDSTDKWADFNLPDCATGPEGNLRYGFQEYPILRTGQAWTGGTDQGPDRVLFQFVTDPSQPQEYVKPFNNIQGKFLYAAYCGLVNHIPKPDGSQYKNAFATCDNSKGGQ
jgi:hypothetical protein